MATMGATHKQVPKRPPQNGKGTIPVGGRTMELGGLGRTLMMMMMMMMMLLRPPAAQFSYRVIAEHAASKERR